MKSYGRKVDAKVQYVPETKQVSKVVVVFPKVGEEANYLLVVFKWTKIVNLSETAQKVGDKCMKWGAGSTK